MNGRRERERGLQDDISGGAVYGGRDSNQRMASERKEKKARYAVKGKP